MLLWGIIILTVACSAFAFRNRWQFERFLFSPARILGLGEYYRMVTSGFLHVDWQHLAFNMFSLYFFGELLEATYSAWTFGLLYLVSILGGSALSLLMHRHDPEYTAVGASGGVCGIIFATIFLVPYSSISIMLLPIWIPDYIFAFIYLGITVYGMKTRAGNIGHDAHMGGAVVAMTAVLLFYPSMVWERIWLYVGLLLFTFALSGYFLKDSLSLEHISIKPQRKRSNWDQPKLKPRPQAKQRAEPTKINSNEALELQVNELLDRVSEKGLGVLTNEERKILNDHAAKLHARRK